MLSFQLLGALSLLRDGQPLVQFRSQKEIALLSFLAHTAQPHSRESIADLLWEDRSTQQSLSNLRTVLARLRTHVGDDLIASRHTVTLSGESLQRVDSVSLLQRLTEAKRVDSSAKADLLQAALATYSGPFLADFRLNDAPRFENWVQTTRQTIQQQVVAAYAKLAHYALDQGNPEFGIRVARNWLQVDALDEEAHTLLIRLLLQAGTVREAIAHYDSCSNLLRAELGIEPPPEMTELIGTVRTHSQSTFTLRSVAATRNNLPALYDQFLGRQQIQQEIHARLDHPWCRLITIIGPGGVGKTRLATTIARNRLNHYVDGVWLVELAEVDPADENLAEAIAVEIASAIDLRLNGPSNPIEQLLSHLQHKAILLVLDNVEHLLAAVPLFLELIQRCQQLQLLVTSREALRIRAEWMVTLSGLPYPSDNDSTTQSEAVDLFWARQPHQRRAHSTDEESAIRSICRMVEGLPLAIELAAALTQHQSCRAVANELNRGFSTLVTNLRDVPQRQRSLLVVFEMSWRALPPALQTRLARLAILTGGFSEEAASQIADADRTDLGRLCEKSLLSYHSEQHRYTMHSVVRAFAAAKVAESDRIPQKHAHYYLNLFAQHAESLQKGAPQQSVAALHPDIDNLRLAWQTGLAAPKFTQTATPQMLLAALTSLSIYYQLRGLAHEGEAVMHSTVDAANNWGAEGIAVAARAGLEQARFQNRLARYRLAIATVEVALGNANLCNDRWAEGMGHVLWGESLWRLGEYELSIAKLTHALTIAHAIDSSLLVGWCHHHLGVIDDIQSRYAAALDHLQQACAAWRAIDNAQALSNSLNSIGLVCYHQGDLSAAQQAMEQALTFCYQLDNRHLQALLLNNLSLIATQQNDYLSAHNYLQLGLTLATTSGNLTGQAEISTSLGKNYHLLGNTQLALENLEEGLQISELIGNLTLKATALFYLAETSRKADSKHAEFLYRQALKLARQYNLQHIECEILIGLAEFLSKNNEGEARQYSTQAVTLAEALQNPGLLERATAIKHYLSVSQM